MTATLQGPTPGVRGVGGRVVLLALLALTAVVSACADAPAGNGGGNAGAAADQAESELVVEVDRGDGSSLESWSLTCGGNVSGTHPDGGAACAHLEELDDPFAPVPGDVCTEQFGGPQTAHITGVWGGKPVDLELSRTDGCRIAQWDALVRLLPS
jgi:Subtilisin inhibitor-like